MTHYRSAHRFRTSVSEVTCSLPFNYFDRYLYFYRPHPKDGEGNVFTLFTPGGGRGQVQPGGGSGPAGGVGQVQPGGRGGSGPAGGGGVGQVQPGGGVGQVQPGGGRGGSGPAGEGGGVGQVQPGGEGWVRSSRGGGGSAKIAQHRKYLLHGGRYASCVHAGGLSCMI